MSWLSRGRDTVLRILRTGTKTAKNVEEGSNPLAAEYTDRGSSESARPVRTLGTFGGVFTPSFLTIIGVIMYLRFSWVVGNAGLIHSIIIVVLANVITFITALSVSSIASNERMETGGAYFMVSRVLGFQAGGGIGIPLYLSQALSISLYIIGFAESLNNVFPHLPIRIISMISLAVLTVIALFGSGVMVKVQYVILVVILFSLVSIGLGFSMGTGVIEPAYGDNENFWSVFAVFFPAVTGILAGVSMSGDLKDPAKSIPRGTLLAVGFGFLIYLVIPVFLAFTLSRNELYSSSALSQAARWPFLVTLGVFGATLSSAIGSLMGAPRTMQALGADSVLPKILGRGVGKTREPLLAMAISLGIAYVALFLGDLNAIAEILTMFFLTTYGVLNFSAALERLVDNPSFRPAVKIPWFISFIGGAGCIAVMFLISAVSTLIAMGLVLVIFIVLGRTKKGPVIQGGLWEGFWTRLFFAVSRRIEKSRSGSGKNWRPMIQVFASDPGSHAELLGTAALLTQRGGSLSAYAMIDPVDREKRLRIASELEQLLRMSINRNSYVSVIETHRMYEGVVVASQASGFAAAIHNSVMLGLPSAGKGDQEYLAMLTQLVHINRNLLLFRRGNLPWTGNKGPIQVWWGGQETNVRLMLILGYLLSENHGYARTIELVTIVSDESETDSARKRLEGTLGELRIQGVSRVVLRSEDRSIGEIIKSESQHSSIVLLGMAKPDASVDTRYLEHLRNVGGGMGATLYVLHNIDDQNYE